MIYDLRAEGGFDGGGLRRARNERRYPEGEWMRDA